jgi:hypothetical protein
MPDLRARRILVLDDEPFMLKLLEPHAAPPGLRAGDLP